ncbi:MAG: methyl-accepting chemotaxis protein [Gammaproteobacteria bacterium]|nr:methyl-accepting chemotaxis protein [Gammaproteobacteria bacterium]
MMQLLGKISVSKKFFLLIGSGIYIDDIDAIFWAGVRQLAGLFGLVLAALVLIAIIVARSITLPIKTLQRVMEAVETNGDLTPRSQISRPDELGRMAAAFDRMLDKLQGFVAGVNEAADGLTASTQRVSAVTEQTNQGVMRQRAETEQVATAMTEMSATVQETATNAAQAAEAAASADREANAGKSVVEATIRAIDSLAGEVEQAAQVIRRLETDALSVSQVLDVIRGIAEQTNLLALNAAIEAARAGDQGRGFAVVADEVRTLAQRTQTSTEEIQAMIESLQAASREAVQAMENGTNQTTSSVEQAARAGEALASITAAVGHINEMNTQIATAAEEQTAVAEEIDHNVVSISEIANQTAAGTEEITAVSEETLRLAQDLQSLANGLSGVGR